jgi:hypothetical protein
MLACVMNLVKNIVGSGVLCLAGAVAAFSDRFTPHPSPLTPHPSPLFSPSSAYVHVTYTFTCTYLILMCARVCAAL